VSAAAVAVLVLAVPAGAAWRGSGYRLIFGGPKLKEIALTFDDDFCRVCVDSLLHVLARTHAHATFCPNGISASGWSPADLRLVRRLAKLGQVAFCNHTWSHRNIRGLSDSQLTDELLRNERWIERTFGVPSYPYFRPPYGAYSQRTLDVAARLGWTRIVLWNGTLADSSPHTIPYLVHAIRYWAHPGAIILSHGNFPYTGRALPQILAILRARHLRTVTLPELLGHA
jgi:peptidoglycan/xylan/chitin deacetylase (PgdA/CDA1 family)